MLWRALRCALAVIHSAAGSDFSLIAFLALTNYTHLRIVLCIDVVNLLEAQQLAQRLTGYGSLSVRSSAMQRLSQDFGR